MDENFGSYLKRKREEKGYTLVQLAELSGVSIAQLSRLENGLRESPKPETIKKLSSALDVSNIEMMVVAGHWDKDDLLEPIDVVKEKPDMVQKYLDKHQSTPETDGSPDPVGVLESGLKAKVPVEELLDWVTLTRGGKVLDRDTASKALDLLLKALDMMEN